VIGPTRMHYSRAITLVDTTTQAVSRVLRDCALIGMAETLNEQDPQQAEQAEQAERTDAQPDPQEELRREKDALQDRLLRTAAEFDNYRKRVDRERRDLAEFTAAEVLRDVLPIVDNLERALAAAGEGDPLRKGVELIHKQMLDLLRKRGVKPIEALGADFDPNFHQAVVHETSSEHREGEVMEELQRGYLLGDRLLRPAMVKVAKAA
jgi:molecular chaperone GrpE